jgi:hypothetical protein
VDRCRTLRKTDSAARVTGGPLDNHGPATFQLPYSPAMTEAEPDLIAPTGALRARNDLLDEGIPFGLVLDVSIVLKRQTVFRLLIVAIATLTALSGAGQVVRYHFDYPNALGLVDFFYVDLENNLPTWFQSVMLLACAGLLAAIARGQRQMREPFARHWLALACIFLLMSIDEVSSIHERTIEPLQRVTGVPEGLWMPTWVMIGIPVVLIVGAAYIRFLLHLNRREQFHVVLAAGLFIGGAVGVEMATSPWWTPAKDAAGFIILTHVEELLEMLGLMTFIDFLLGQLRSTRLSFAIGRS